MLKTLAIAVLVSIVLAVGWFFDARELRVSLKAEQAQTTVCQDANDSATRTIGTLKKENQRLADAARVAVDAARDAREKSQQQATRDAERLAATQKLLRDAYDTDKDTRTWADSPVPAAIAGRLRQ